MVVIASIDGITVRIGYRSAVQNLYSEVQYEHFGQTYEVSHAFFQFLYLCVAYSGEVCKTQVFVCMCFCEELWITVGLVLCSHIISTQEDKTCQDSTRTYKVPI